MTRLGFLLFALIVRVLWACPVWVSLIGLAVIGIVAGAEWERHRVSVKAFQAESDTRAEQWQPCCARKKTSDGFEVECVKRAGHDGDDADHLADRTSIYWPGN